MTDGGGPAGGQTLQGDPSPAPTADSIGSNPEAGSTNRIKSNSATKSAEVEQDNKDKLREEKERMRDDKFKMDDESYVTLETDPADKIYTEQSISSEEWAPNEIDDGNTINPIIVDRYSIQKQMPNLYLADDI